MTQLMPNLPKTSQDNCEKPRCTNDPVKRYSGPHGNTLELCSHHYYELVSGKRATTVTIDGRSGTDIGRLQFERSGPPQRDLGDPPNPFKPDSDLIK